jgi:hypothetical protein
MKRLAFLILCFASIAFADDFKTVNGKEYKNATVSRVEPDGIVLITSSGVSKVYFTELPKEVQKRFYYDPGKAENERAAAIKERAKKEENAAENLRKSEEQFEAAENRAAQNYKSSEKGTLSGQIFVATNARANVKLGAQRVSLFARDAIDVLLAGLRNFADAKIEQLRLDIAATATAEEQAEAAVEQAEAALKQAEATEEKDRELYERGFATADGGGAAKAAKEAANAARGALNRARQAANTARQQIESLLAEEAFYYSGRFHFSHLQSPIQTAETDGEGRFVIQVPRTGAFVIAVDTERMVWDNTEIYYWLQPVSLEGRQQGVQNLSNNNLTETTGTSSLIRTLGNSRRTTGVH